MKKRKRDSRSNGKKHDSKRPRSELHPPGSGLALRVLAGYYDKVTTLRQHLLSQLPKSSKWRRKRILAVPAFSKPTGDQAASRASSALSQQSLARLVEERQMQALSKLLDTALVGVWSRPASADQDTASQDFLRFTQQVRQSNESGNSEASPADLRQEDAVDFAVGRLFYKTYPRLRYPPHMLCHGYNRTYQHHLTADDQGLVGGILGLDCMFPNPYVATLKSGPWQQVLRLVGREGDVKVMLDLLLHCGIFLPLESGTDNYYQLCGKLLSDFPTSKPGAVRLPSASNQDVQPKQGLQRTPNEICFVRSRLMHGRAALNRFNETRFGLPHIHVLNKYRDTSSSSETRHVAMYIFPCQFRLHNVFTSTVDRRHTAQPFKDYTLREEEIRNTPAKWAQGQSQLLTMPKRLRGPCLELVRRLRRRHCLCSYTELLKHYCGVPSLDQREPRKQRKRRPPSDQTQAPFATLAIEEARKQEHQQFVDFATPAAHVSAYCRAVMANLLPNDFFGTGEDGIRNQKLFMHSVDVFVNCSRFEKMSLQTLYHGQKISCIPWLQYPASGNARKLSITDKSKREELYLEFLYYSFDSILIPLLRSTFHITESTQHGNRIFYFRHDVWRALIEPHIREIKQTTFVELPKDHASQLLKQRKLGFGQVRLMPKGTGVRMITNLRRREIAKGNAGVELGRSVNTQLDPVHCMLKCERAGRADELRGSLFSVDDIHLRLKSFRSRLLQSRSELPELYFVKVDVKSCFDTIPQAALLGLLRRLCSDEAYSKVKHLELRSSEIRPRRFVSSAKTLIDYGSFPERVDAGPASARRGAIFTEVIMGQILDKDWLMGMLREHVQENVVRIGKKYCRQQNGIPQGSVLSTLLCSFFYADFEAEHVSYLEPENSLLLRLIDDFLLVTTNRDHAVRFVEQMHRGCEDYGIHVRPEKTLTNFRWDGKVPAGPHKRNWFPYCGVMIGTETLELSRDRGRRLGASLKDAITAERSARPGANFVKKTLHAFRVQTSAMLTDTGLNSQDTVLTTLYLNFVETAMKMHRYLKTLGGSRPINTRVVIGAIRALSRLARTMTEAKGRNATPSTSAQARAISQGHVQWLLASAFVHVLRRKQSRYSAVLTWLEARRRSWSPRDVAKLTAIARRANAVYRGYRY